MVEGIKSLGAELQVDAITEVELLVKSEVEIGQPRPIDDVAARVAKAGVPAVKAASRASVVKQLVLNQSATVRGPLPWQIRSGRGLWSWYWKNPGTKSH